MLKSAVNNWQRNDKIKGRSEQLKRKQRVKDKRAASRVKVEIEILSVAEKEWKRVGVHRRATSTAVHCSAQPPLFCAHHPVLCTEKTPAAAEQHSAEGCMLIGSTEILTHSCAS